MLFLMVGMGLFVVLPVLVMILFMVCAKLFKSDDPTI